MFCGHELDLWKRAVYTAIKGLRPTTNVVSHIVQPLHNPERIAMGLRKHQTSCPHSLVLNHPSG